MLNLENKGFSARRSKNIVRPSMMFILYPAYGTIAAFFPKSVYEDLLREHNFAFLNVKLLLFVWGCCAFLFIGSYLTSLYFARRFPPLDGPVRLTTDFPLMVVSVIILGLNIISSISILENNRELIASLLKGTASSFKESFIPDDALLGANPLLIILAWVLFREFICGGKSRKIIFMLLSSIFLSIFISLIKIARFEIVPLFVGMAVIGLAFGLGSGRGIIRTAWRAVVFASALIGMFVFIGLLRHSADSGEFSALSSFLGYTLSPFNRLSLLLDGGLHYTYAGTGFYILDFVRSVPVIGSIMVSDLPDGASVFRSEFRDIALSGLDPSYNWCSMFGYYFAEAGLLLFPACIVIGAVTQVVWHSLLGSRVLGIIFFPLIANAFVLSFSFYWLTQRMMVSGLVFLVLLLLARFLFVFVFHRADRRELPYVSVAAGQHGSEWRRHSRRID